MEQKCTQMDRLLRMEEKLEYLPGIEAKMDRLIADMEILTTTVNGNGAPGIKQAVALNTAHRVRMEKLFDNLVAKMIGLVTLAAAVFAGISKVL